MKLFVSAAALAIGLAAAAGAASAAQTEGAPKPGSHQLGMIKAMDTDGDGKISKSEFLAYQPKNRPALAADAKITREDFVKHGHRRPAVNHASPSPERKARMEERRAEAFKAIDKDGNGSISKDEFMGFHGMVRTSAQRKDRMEKMEGRRAEAFKRLDANNDGVIDGSERAAAREAAFARMDRNSDGFISSDELPRRSHRKHR